MAVCNVSNKTPERPMMFSILHRRLLDTILNNVMSYLSVIDVKHKVKCVLLWPQHEWNAREIEVIAAGIHCFVSSCCKL